MTVIRRIKASQRPRTKRTGIPEVYRRQFITRLKRLLEYEGKRRAQHAAATGQESSEEFALILLALQKERGIPIRTVNAFLRNERFPSALDMRELARFCQVTVEELMSDLPSPAGTSQNRK